mmetsp:Transcript_2653/g.8882  ORF Transcript_2653/g.8882 Transcript_2653/m.8882 type:complete len:672 (-) Transcript_2653:1990-4005(-)
MLLAASCEGEDDDASWGSEFEDGDNSEEDHTDKEIDSITYSAIKCMHQVALTPPEALEHGPEHDASNTGIPHYIHACNGMRVRLQPLVVAALNHPDMELQHAGLVEREGLSLAAAMKHNRVVQAINLSGNSLKSAGDTLARALEQNDRVTQVRIKAADLTPAAGTSFGALLRSNCSITLLDLSSNKLGDRSLSALLLALCTNSTLRHLFIADNGMAALSARACQNMLPCNTSLRVLDLSWNHLQLSDIRSISGGLAGNSTLQSLNLSWNGLSGSNVQRLNEDCFLAFTRALDTSHSLTELDLSYCRISETQAVFLCSAISTNKGLTSLKLDGNPIGDSITHVHAKLRARQESVATFRYSANGCTSNRSKARGFDDLNPSGHYRLDVSIAEDLRVLRILEKQAKRSDGEAWRSESCNGERFQYLPASGKPWRIPLSGVVELDFVLLDGTKAEAEASEEAFKSLTEIMSKNSDEEAKIDILQRACSVMTFSVRQAINMLFMFSLESCREKALVMLFSRIIDRRNLWLCNKAFSERSRLNLQRRLGARFVMMSDAPVSGRFWLDLSKSNDRKVLQLMMEDVEGEVTDVKLLHHNTTVYQADKIDMSRLQGELVDSWSEALSAGVVELCYASSGKKDAQEQDKVRRVHSRLQDHTESSSSKLMTTTREGTAQMKI